MSRSSSVTRASLLFAAIAGTLLASCGSPSPTGSSTTGTGGNCHGDGPTWAELTDLPIACTKDSDCCVIFNGCLATAQLVSATNQAAAKAAWPYCDDVCAGCIAPAVEVGCEGGTCAGKAVDPTSASPDLRADHCGSDPQVGLSAGKQTFTCGG